MDKAQLKNYLNVILGELKHDIDYEDGVFDETATNAFKKALKCKDILCKDSKTTMIQFETSVETENAVFIWIDGIVQAYDDENHVFFTTSDEDDIFNTELNEVERKYIIKAIEKIVELCK